MMVLVLAWATASACADGNAPPSLLWIPDQTVSVGQRLQVPITAVDGDGDAVSFELSGLPEGAELATPTATSQIQLDPDEIAAALSEMGYLGAQVSPQP